MTVLLPRWLPNDPDPPHRAADVDAAVGALLTEPTRPVSITSDAGLGRTAVAGAVATRLGLPTVATRLAGCRGPSDVVLLVGHALDALPPGSESACGAALRALGTCLVLLDDADVPGVAEAVARLAATVPEARWLLAGARAPTEGPEVAIRPLPHGSGNPLHDRLAAGRGGDPWAILLDLPPRVDTLALVEPGLPGSAPIPSELLLPTSDGRQVLRRAVAEEIRRRRAPEPSRVAAALVATYEPVLTLAVGAPLRPDVSPPDALVLRWMGEVLADPDDASRATATAARLLSIWGQPAEARDLLQTAARRNSRASAAARSLLAWADAEILLASGAEQAARRQQTHAARLLEDSPDLALRASLSRRWGDVLAARGALAPAAEHYREARALYRREADPAGVSATLRGAADVAVASGEILSAEALYDQAEATPAGPVEIANRALGQAALALARGDLSRARDRLDIAALHQASLPVLAADVLWRRADLALRQGQHEEASRFATQALDGFARSGERVAVGHTTRLLGDIAAARGDLAIAALHYAEACQFQVQAGDVGGLHRTLHHAATLELEAGDPALAAELDGLIADLG